MTEPGLRPYRAGDAPLPGSVPVAVIILTLNEELNIAHCLNSVAWAQQRIVVDSGSTDETISIAKSFHAEIVEQPWLGFSGQREFALHLSAIRHKWVYFIDADEWVSPQLAAEIAGCIASAGSAAGFSHRLRLIYQGRWIRHCGWYSASWRTLLVDRHRAKWDGRTVGERVRVDGPVHRLKNDLVDEDRKGPVSWLHKHVDYADLEARSRQDPAPFHVRLRDWMSPAAASTRPPARALLKEVLFPSVPAKPLTLFVYMYVLRLGVLDGLAGLRFCFYHAWYEVTVNALRDGSSAPRHAAATTHRIPAGKKTE